MTNAERTVDELLSKDKEGDCLKKKPIHGEGKIRITAKGIALLCAVQAGFSVEKTEIGTKVQGFEEFWTLFTDGLKKHPLAAEELFKKCFPSLYLHK